MRVCFLWVLVTGAFSAYGETVVDRLLFEVDLRSYSQSQMELYLLCKDAVGGAETLRTVGGDNWDRLLEEFKNDMIIQQEALRLGSFEASTRVLEKALEVFQERLNRTEAASTTLSR